MRVLVLGADGFIGRHVIFALRDLGAEVIASARNTRRLASMGFATVQADLLDTATHTPAFWTPHLTPDTHVIIAAGLLDGSAQEFESVHISAPMALLAARKPGTTAVLLSAVGLDTATTDFAHYRRRAEAMARTHGATILRPGLVLADTSYGGSSLLRALAALPFVTPVIGDGTQPFNPVHAADLAELTLKCLATPPGPGPWQVGGPETLTQAALIAQIRAWLGLPPARPLHLPIGLARILGRIGDALKLGPISATTIAQLQAGVIADTAPLQSKIPHTLRPASRFIHARPAGSQDLWHARLYLIKPLLRLCLSVLWLASGLLGLFLPGTAFLPLGTLLPDGAVIMLARIGGLIDIALGLALLRNWQPRKTALFQILMVLAYTMGLTLFAPHLWLDPFGGLLKNIPILALLFAHLALTEDR